MTTTFVARVGFSMLLGAGSVGTYVFCHTVKKETLLLVSQRVHRHRELQEFTQKLIEKKPSS